MPQSFKEHKKITIPVLVMKELRGLAVEVAMLAELVDIHANSMLPLPLPGDGNACTNLVVIIQPL